MTNKLAVLISIALLAGCSTQASRMSDCESQGISKDACYIAEQNKQASVTNAAETAALRNATKSVEQTTYQPFKTHLAGLNIEANAQGQMYVDGKPALITEDNVDAITYQQGGFDIIHYKRTHKLFVLQNGKIVGRGKI